MPNFTLRAMDNCRKVKALAETGCATAVIIMPVLGSYRELNVKCQKSKARLQTVLGFIKHSCYLYFQVLPYMTESNNTLLQEFKKWQVHSSNITFWHNSLKTPTVPMHLQHSREYGVKNKALNIHMKKWFCHSVLIINTA